MELNFLQAYAITLAAEMLALNFLLRKQYPRSNITINAMIASSITLPFVWFVFPAIFGDYTIQIAVSEFFAFAAEAGIYLVLFKGMKIRDAISVSFACNAASFLLGLAISRFI